MHDVTIRKKAMISQPMNGLTDEGFDNCPLMEVEDE